MTKARFAVDRAARHTAQRVLAHALDVLLRLLHPMMPFLTEEVWQLLAQVAPNARPAATARAERPPLAESICIAPWPIADTARQDATIEAQFADFQAVLGAVREIRQRQNIPLKEELDVHGPLRRRHREAARSRCSRTSRKWPAPRPRLRPRRRRRPSVAASVTLAGQHGPIEVHVDVSRFIDVGAERKRLEKERDNLAKQIDSIDAKLANKAFVDKAPAEVVQQQRDKLAELRGQLVVGRSGARKAGGDARQARVRIILQSLMLP